MIEMARKNDYNYFDAFAKLSKFSYDLAITLNETLTNFDPKLITNKVTEAHAIEHNADIAKHEIMNRLVKEFLPPIEREDITSLTQEIDDVTDSVEDVLIYIDMFNIQKIRPEILKFTQLIVDCCKALDEALDEFKNFKSSKTLRDKIIEINHLEENGDALYVDSMRNLYHTSTDPIELMCWTEILHRLERCCDNCEDVANIIESIVMKNS
jgi:predicted phosphate transport protein (TIGR00153 family)